MPQPRQACPRPNSPWSIPQRRKQVRILLAEDNKINQQYASVVLNKAGYHVTIAENGRHAVERASGRRFRPGADGHPDARTGRRGSHRARSARYPRRKNAVPIFAMTAHAMRGSLRGISGRRHERLCHQAVPARLLLAQAGAPGRRQACPRSPAPRCTRRCRCWTPPIWKNWPRPFAADNLAALITCICMTPKVICWKSAGANRPATSTA